MNRSSNFAVLIAIVIAIDLSGCASANSRRLGINAQLSGQPCLVSGNRGWQEVQSEGFTFCVPQNWTLDAKFEARHKARYPSFFRMVSYTAPDTLQRVVFELPDGSGAKAELDYAIEQCGIDKRYAQSITIAGGPGCASNTTGWTLYTPQAIYTNVGGSQLNTAPAYDYRPMTTITYSIPRIRGRAMGPGVAMGVLNTVRAVPAP